MSLQVTLAKEGETIPKLALDLMKEDSFTIRLSWDEPTAGERSDVDLHAIVCLNDGSGARAGAMEDVLSAYNVRRTLRGREVGTLPRKADGTFEVHRGALVHSADAMDGSRDGIDEWIKVSPALLPAVSGGVREIPLIAMIHPPSSGRRFRDVRNAAVEIHDGNGQRLLRAVLSSQFGDFAAVQMGAVMIRPDGVSEFVAIGVGFDGDFNTVLAHFS